MISPRLLPPDARRSLAVYNLFFPFVFLLLLPGYVARLLRRGNYRAHFGQRLGRYSPADRAFLAEHRWTWIQSISVGETLLALKLAHALRVANPTIHIVLSTTTTTGFALAEASAAEWLRPVYNPIDLRGIVRRTVAVLRPERLLVIEGGMWPNILAECYTAGIPVMLINARLSPRSAKRFSKFRRWTGPLFRLFDLITVPEEADVERWVSLEAHREQVHVTGSIKFDQPTAQASRTGEFRELLNGLGVAAEAPIFVAGSTFEGEEALLARVLLELRRTWSDLLLILVPRHVERTPAILRELAALSLRIARRSALAASSLENAAPEILLVDTTGELRDWYELATLAYVGKSLTAVGGQNPAEPAMLGTPVLFGPHMENFASLRDHLVKIGAAREVADEADLLSTTKELLNEAALRVQMSAAGRSSLTAHQGATMRNVTAILQPQ